MEAFPGCFEQLFALVAVDSRTASHVGLASALASHEGSEGPDQVSGAVSSLLPIRSAEGSEMELLPVINHEEGRAAEPGFLQPVQQFLEKGGRSLEDFDQSGGVGISLQEGREEGVRLTGGIGGLGLLESLFRLDGDGLDELGFGPLGERQHIGPESLQPLVGRGQLGYSSLLFLEPN